jgi:hypothetical protein
MKDGAIGPWRSSPFVVGQRYRVRRDFKSLRDTFRAGEVLTYERDTWSRYDGCTGYVFAQPSTSMPRCWDIYDDEDLALWLELFEALPNAEESTA